MLLHDSIKTSIDKLKSDPSHGIVISGAEGAGKFYLAKQIARQILKITPSESLISNPNIRIISPEKNNISVDQIRELQSHLKLKVPGKARIRRVVIIQDAHLMNTEAQNALLKSLEEPPADTVIMLTALSNIGLLPTILSRVQNVSVLPVSLDQANEYYSADYSQSEVERALMLSGGQAGLLDSILRNKQHPILEQISTAKSLLADSKYKKLLSIERIIKDKEQVPGLLQALKLICNSALHNTKHNKEQAKLWHHRLSAVYNSESIQSKNPNAKLQLTDLFLNL